MLQLRSSLTSSFTSLATPAHAGAPVQEVVWSAHAHLPAHMLAAQPQARGDGVHSKHGGGEADYSATLSSHPLRHRLSRVAEAGAGSGEAQDASMVARGLSLSAISHGTPARRPAQEVQRGQERVSEPLSNISNVPVSHAPLRRSSPRASASVLTASEQLGAHGKSVKRALEDEDQEWRHDFLGDYSAGMGSRVLWPGPQDPDPHGAGLTATPAKSVAGGTGAAGVRQDDSSQRRADAGESGGQERVGHEPGQDPLVKQHIREQLQHVEDRAAELEKREMQVEAQRRELQEEVEHHNSKFLEAEKRIQKRVQKLEKLNFRNQLKAYLSDSSATNTSNTTNPPR